MDTLSKNFEAEKFLDVVLMNPHFTGKMDSDVNPALPDKCKKTELLFTRDNEGTAQARIFYSG